MKIFAIPMTSFTSTPLEDIPEIRDALLKGFGSGKTKSIKYRKEQLLQLAYLLKDNHQRFLDALAKDLGRPALETDFTEMTATLGDIYDSYNNVGKWAKDEKAPFSVLWYFMNPTVRKEPKGVVLIIGPFNFPILCLLMPLACALAAGNTVLLKPSELSTAVSDLVAELVPKYFEPGLVRVVQGGIPQTSKLIEYPWGHICYTGSPRVARIIAHAAANTLTPVTFELGGKNPTIVDAKGDLKLAARRILWGRNVNAGQACTAPEYVLVMRSVEEEFIKELQNTYATYYENDPSGSKSFSRIITQEHASRIAHLLSETKGKIVAGGEVDTENKYIAPTIVRDVPPDDSLMSEEIFGPVLSIIPVDNIDEAIAFAHARDKPLAVYIFTSDKKVKEKVIENTSSGAVFVNDVLIHPGATGLPFGGIGLSGYGCMTGKWGFNTFTHFRALLDSPGYLDTLALWPRFPPYTDEKYHKIRSLSAFKLPPRPGNAEAPRRKWGLYALFAMFGAVVAVLGRKVGSVFGSTQE
ncbi:unnamed protein product [Somion occarium]|uniref:Aldehyde dehydrogenase n=1 Tax=Somion occarium TaxID=3059160 RepID=A0ABP1CNW6_9APHY